MNEKKEEKSIQEEIEQIRGTSIDQLKFLYYLLKDKMLSEVESMNEDITEIFWEALFDKLDNNEILVINCTGEVTTGKSTVMAVIRRAINNYIEQKKYTKKPIIMRETFYMDETEFINSITKVTGKKDQHDKIFIQIDDRNSLGDGYLNATTDKQLFDTFSDMFAQQNISRGYCSPADSPDKNSIIWLEVIGRNKETKTTTCKVIYNNPIEKQQVTLGRAIFYVGTTIEEEWYKEERKRKFERHDLIHKHGVRDIRDLIFAPLVMESYKELKEIARTGKISKDIILPTVEDVARTQKRFLSQFTLLNVATRTSGLLALISEISKAEKRKEKLLAKGFPRPMNLIDEQTQKIEHLTKRLNSRITEETRLSQLYDDYKAI